MATPEQAINHLIKVIENSSYGQGVRAAAAEGLGFAGGATARAHLINVLESSSYGQDVRAAAARALGHAVNRE